MIDHANLIRQRFLRFLRAKTDHRDRLPRAHVVHDGWRAPQLFMVGFSFLLALAVVSVNDDLVIERERTAELTRDNLRLARLLDQPGVRLVERSASGFVCRTTRVQREWERAVAVRCEHLAQMLHTARASE